MKEEIIISGFGGQGVLSMGKILAYAGLLQGQEVSWMPSYGPEQRGGTANVTVILSDERISSPVLNAYDTVVVLNQPSLERFEPKVKPGGTLLYSTCTTRKCENEGVVTAFLEENRAYSVAEMRTLWPDLDGTDGFFICRLVKSI